MPANLARLRPAAPGRFSLLPRIRRAGLPGWLPFALTALAADPSGNRVGTWAASPQLAEPGNRPPAPGLADAMLRQVIHVSLRGKKVRLRLANAFGDAATRDPQNPSRLARENDRNDHLHLNPAGYARMAQAVDLRLFAN